MKLTIYNMADNYRFSSHDAGFTLLQYLQEVQRSLSRISERITPPQLIHCSNNFAEFYLCAADANHLSSSKAYKKLAWICEMDYQHHICFLVGIIYKSVYTAHWGMVFECKNATQATYFGKVILGIRLNFRNDLSHQYSNDFQLLKNKLKK